MTAQRSDFHDTNVKEYLAKRSIIQRATNVA